MRGYARVLLACVLACRCGLCAGHLLAGALHVPAIVSEHVAQRFLVHHREPDAHSAQVSTGTRMRTGSQPRPRPRAHGAGAGPRAAGTDPRGTCGRTGAHTSDATPPRGTHMDLRRALASSCGIAILRCRVAAASQPVSLDFDDCAITNRCARTEDRDVSPSPYSRINTGKKITAFQLEAALTQKHRTHTPTLGTEMRPQFFSR